MTNLIPHGIVPNMPFEDYLAHPAYGSSDVAAFKAGPPAMVPWRRANREGSDATKIGSAAHCQILTPDLFPSQWIVKPEGMKFTTKEGKAWRDEHLEAGATLEQMLSWLEATQIDQIRSAFSSKDLARKALDSAEMVEASVFWICAATGLPLKGRPDFFDKGWIYDLKISIEACKGIDMLRYKAFNLGWVHQLASNRAGLRANGYPDVKHGGLIVIAPKPPQGIRTWLMHYPEHELDVCELDNENIRREMKICHDSGQWPGTPDGWVKCALPSDHLMADLEVDDEDDGEVEGDDEF